MVAVPLASHGDAEVDHALGLQVATNYAGPNPVLGALRRREDRPSTYPDDIAEIVDFDQPPADRQGLVLFFTGLSGSGKSTLARALMDRLLEHGVRTVTTLDGDVVRRHLSAGLTFSKEDRETNIRRIGWVAAEISRHGGVAVCSPIAPFDETRQQVRAMVEQAGGAFFLVHVATPLEECERRDRKGLYAKARRGEIPEFTGISSPYEEPADADVRVDTTGRTIEDALDDVLVALRDEGYLDLTHEEPTTAPFDPARRPRWASSERRVEVRARAPASVVETPEAEAGPDPLHVLFVCTANICRSPWMELASRHLVGDLKELEFSSAGTHGFRDRAMDPVMAAHARAAGRLRRRVPQPAADPRDGRAGRPRPHRRERAPQLHPRRPPGRLPQGVHARPVRRGRPELLRRARPAAPCSTGSASGAAPRTRPSTSPTPTAGARRPPRQTARLLQERLRAVLTALLG